MGIPNDDRNSTAPHAELAEELPEEELEEINVEITDEGLVWIYGEFGELFLSPEEAKTLGEALIDTAKDAVEGLE